MVGLLGVLFIGFIALFGFFWWVSRDMRRGLCEMQRLTREVEALLDEGASRQV
ncbi:MAG TPA: hypothetical protein VGL14_08210 [Methylomirabilota bacterium]|jgi:hypothetical protein